MKTTGDRPSDALQTRFTPFKRLQTPVQTPFHTR